MKNKICIIGVYFGKLPNYFSLWMKSCEKNTQVDFFIITDQIVENTPKNVKSIAMTLAEMQKSATEVLGFEASLERPYKCCDYKVIYGLIFKDYIEGYDYWGHCDFDLIFGDLNSFFENCDLYKYDRFLALGHLSLYKNTDEVNQRYLCSGSTYDYKTVFTTDSSFAFDELMCMGLIYQKNGFSMFAKRIFADIASVYHRYRIIDEYPLDEKPKNYPYQVFYWENGKTYRAYFLNNELHTEEYMYIHFKKRPDFEVDFDVDSANAFYITNRGFVKKQTPVTLEICKQLNPYRGILYELYELIRYHASLNIHKIIHKIKILWRPR